MRDNNFEPTKKYDNNCFDDDYFKESIWETENKTYLVNIINENRASLSDEQVLKLLLLFLFKEDKAKQVWKRIENEVVGISSLLDIEALCMFLGDKDEDIIAFLKVLRRITDIIAEPSELVGEICVKEEIASIFEGYIADELVENICVAFLDDDNKLLGIKKYSDSEKSRVKLELSNAAREAFLCNASKVMIAHNHTSGALIRSKSDFELTRRLATELNATGITIDEHFIVTKNGYIETMSNTEDDDDEEPWF